MRLARQLLTESLLLALIGGALGLFVAQVATGAIGALIATGATPMLLDLRPNATVLIFTATITILTGLVFGLAPAIGCTQVDTAPALKALGAGTPKTSSRLRWSTRQTLVASQIALCVLLASGAGLLVRTLRNLESRDGGFDRHQLLLFSLDARRTPFPVTQVPALCDALAGRLVQRGDVLSAACARNIVMSSRGNARPLEVPGAPPLPQNERVVFTNMVTPEYFRTLGIGLAAGRVFDARDSATAERVAVINRSLARHFFGTEDPVGRPVQFYQDKGPPIRIVGVVEDAMQRTVREGVLMTIYTPLAQVREPEGLVTMAVRARTSPLALAASVRDDVRAMTPHVVVDNIRTMDQQIGTTLVRERLLAFLSAGFGVLALTMACVGLFGVVSFDVSRRQRDIGVRLALGARRVNVIWHVLRTALVVSLAGIAAGLAATLAATRTLSALLFDITSRDPLTLGASATLLLLTALAASFLPAHRASRVDPIVVLRTE
jgi:predicted permease